MMPQLRIPRSIPLLAFAAVLVFATACGQQAEAPEETAADETGAPSTEVEAATDDREPHIPLTAAVAVLKTADLYDGEEDKVISKCPACNLGMDGSAEHALHFDGYELHFCSEGCKEHFGENTEAAVLAMKIPED